MTSNRIPSLDLYLDESGTFMETSTVPGERAAGQARSFPSQLAGLLLARGELTKESAQQLLDEAYRAAGMALPEQVHGTSLPSGEAYDALIRALLAGLARRRWQPVRLVNLERVRYGDRVATYTNLVAELVLRVCQQYARQGHSRVTVGLCCANVKIGESDDGTPEIMAADEYLARLNEYLGFTAVRRGVAREAADWVVDDFRLGSGRYRRDLQLCDLLSNASHDNYRKCGPALAGEFRAAFGPFDFSLQLREPLERADAYLADDCLALAVQTLAERLVQSDGGGDLREGARRRLETVVGRLAAMSAPARDAHLAVLDGWLRQLVDGRRASALGERLARWLLSEVAGPLRRHLAGGPDRRTADWWDYSLHLWCLACANHRGDAVQARVEAAALDRLAPSLAGNWEHGPLLLKGLIAQAVHQTDCAEYDAASARMRAVAGFYGDLGGLFVDALPEVFPARIRSSARGSALGTWLQSEIGAGLRDASRLEQARRISDQAIDEFANASDQERQYQYRCQLEVTAGNLAEARSYLARSLRLAESSHEAIAAALVALPESATVALGFGLLHWLRLGVACCLSDAVGERRDFLAALAASRLLVSSWCGGERDFYPAHGILRRAAVLLAVQGERDQSLAALAHLSRTLDPIKAGQAVLGTVQLAAAAEVAAMLWAGERRHARQVLDSDASDRPGLKQLLSRFERRFGGGLPKLWSSLASWRGEIDRVFSETEEADVAARRLLAMARPVGH